MNMLCVSSRKNNNREDVMPKINIPKKKYHNFALRGLPDAIYGKVWKQSAAQRMSINKFLVDLITRGVNKKQNKA